MVIVIGCRTHDQVDVRAQNICYSRISMDMLGPFFNHVIIRFTVITLHNLQIYFLNMFILCLNYFLLVYNILLV